MRGNRKRRERALRERERERERERAGVRKGKRDGEIKHCLLET